MPMPLSREEIHSTDTPRVFHIKASHSPKIGRRLLLQSQREDPLYARVISVLSGELEFTNDDDVRRLLQQTRGTFHVNPDTGILEHSNGEHTRVVIPPHFTTAHLTYFSRHTARRTPRSRQNTKHYANSSFLATHGSRCCRLRKSMHCMQTSENKQTNKARQTETFPRTQTLGGRARRHSWTLPHHFTRQ